MKKENLEDYLGAYSNEFKFKNENELYLSRFAKFILDDIDKNKWIESYLSLGIGHQIVSKSIISRLNKNIGEYHIIDGSQSMIKNHQTENQNIDNIFYHLEYFEDFNFDKQFDRIEMGFILEHVDDPLFILNKYKKFIKPGGIFHIAVPNARSLHRLIGLKAGMIDDIYLLSEYDLMLGHKRYYDLETIKKDIEKSQLRILEIKGLMLKPITNNQMNLLNFNTNIYSALLDIGENYPEIANCIYIKATI